MLNSLLEMITKVGFNNLQCWRRKGAQQLRPVTNKTFSSFSFCHWQTGKLANWKYFSSIICLRYRYCSAVGSSLSIEHCKLFRLIIFFTEAGNISVKFTQVISLSSAEVSYDLVGGVSIELKKVNFANSIQLISVLPCCRSKKGWKYDWSLGAGVHVWRKEALLLIQIRSSLQWLRQTR